MYTLLKLAFKVSDMANKAPSDYLMSLCHSAYFHYVDDLVLVYAIVKTDFDESILDNFPVVKFDFEISELKIHNDFYNNILEVANGNKKFMGDI
jgi:hypothetical protein